MVITGLPLSVAIALLCAWLSLLYWTIRTIVRSRIGPLSLRYCATLGAVACASIAVLSLLAINLSWTSVRFSQSIGVRPIQIISAFLFWSTAVGVVLGLVGSGKKRFIGVGTCVLTGCWWFMWTMGSAISMSPSIIRHPTTYLIPNGYIGWVEIQYDVDAPPLPISDGKYICRIPANGSLRTASALENGWAKDEYFYYLGDGSLEPLRETGWGKGGMIWGGETETSVDSSTNATQSLFRSSTSAERINISAMKPFRHAGRFR